MQNLNFQTQNFNNSFANIDNNFEFKRDFKVCQNKTQWNNVVSDRLVKRIMKTREQRMDYIRINKTSIIDEIRCENIIEDYCDEDSLYLSEFFDKILTLFENDVISQEEYEIEINQNPAVSACPICSYPVISTNKKVLCLNLCFEYNIPVNLFSDKFTLDNFIDIFTKTYYMHQQCNSGLQLLIFEDDINIVCSKCLSEINKI